MTDAGRSDGSIATWDDHVAEFWRNAEDARPDDMWAALEPLLAQRPADDATATFERASLHDYLGEEAAAIPHYQDAIARGLSPERRGYALIQLASSLRNVGRAAEALVVLEPLESDSELGLAARAFRALVLHDLGRPSEALRVVLLDHSPQVPLYGGALKRYAELLPRDSA